MDYNRHCNGQKLESDKTWMAGCCRTVAATFLMFIYACLPNSTTGISGVLPLPHRRFVEQWLVTMRGVIWDTGARSGSFDSHIYLRFSIHVYYSTSYGSPFSSAVTVDISERAHQTVVGRCCASLGSTHYVTTVPIHSRT